MLLWFTIGIPRNSYYKSHKTHEQWNFSFQAEFCHPSFRLYLEFCIPKQIDYFQLKVHMTFLINIIGCNFNENYLKSSGLPGHQKLGIFTMLNKVHNEKYLLWASYRLLILKTVAFLHLLFVSDMSCLIFIVTSLCCKLCSMPLVVMSLVGGSSKQLQ